MKGKLGALAERIRSSVRECDQITERDLWSRHQTIVWRARRFSGSPTFYPVYRNGDLYSWSPMALMVLKGILRLNRSAARDAEDPRFLYHSGLDTIDLDIERIGGPSRVEATIHDESVFIEKIASGLRTDAASIESTHPDHTNIILCGGRDSMNLLLLPWHNTTLVVSAPPNFELVKQFLIRNHLDLEIRQLRDEQQDDVLNSEILEGACRLNLAHARWGADLRRLASEFHGKVIFWKGQLADAYTTPKWMALNHPAQGARPFALKVNKRLAPVLPDKIRRTVARGVLEPNFRRAAWERCAMWQGAHLSLIRAVADALVLSAYHGPEMTKVFSEVDLFSAVRRDVRPDVGCLLLGRPPFYPTENPGPDLSRFRVGLCHPKRFLALVAADDLPVEST